MDIVKLLDTYQGFRYTLQERVDKWLSFERASYSKYIHLRLGFFCFVYGKTYKAEDY